MSPHVEHRWYHALICRFPLQYSIFQQVFKGLQAWPDIIKGSTPEYDVVISPPVRSFCPQSFHCVRKTIVIMKTRIRWVWDRRLVYLHEWLCPWVCEFCSHLSFPVLSSKVSFTKHQGSGGWTRGWSLRKEQRPHLSHCPGFLPLFSPPTWEP